MSLRNFGEKTRRSLMMTLGTFLPLDLEAEAAPVEPPKLNSGAIVFGVDLLTAASRSARIHSRLPDVVYKSFVYLQEHGLHEEGIFRLTGSINEMKAIRAAFDNGDDFDLTTCWNVHTVSGILKLYLRELPHALVPDNDIPEDEEAEGFGDKVSEVLLALPSLNRILLGTLCRLLNQICKNEEETKMGIRNLVIVFSATLNIRTSILSNLILNAFTHFPNDELSNGLRQQQQSPLIEAEAANRDESPTEVVPIKPPTKDHSIFPDSAGADIFGLSDAAEISLFSGKPIKSFSPPKASAGSVWKKQTSIFDEDDEDDSNGLFDRLSYTRSVI